MEFHKHPTTELYDVLASGMVARQQPLIAIITTAGLDLNSPCYRIEYDLVSKILDPDIDVNIESYFVMINELDKDDDIKDEAIWAKANPLLCSYPEGVKSIRERLEVALEAPEKMTEVMTKTFNVWVQAAEGAYMDMSKLKRCQAKSLPELKGLPTTVGIDLSRCNDLTSVSFISKLPNKQLVITSHSFVPEDAIRIKEQREKMPYSLWIKQGWITATPGEVIDYNFVLQYILDTYKKNSWKRQEAAYDRALAMWLETELQKAGFTPIDIPQGFMTLSEPTKNLRNKIYEQTVILEEDPVLNWAFSNCILRDDVNGNVCIDRKASNHKIDPVAATIDAYVRVLANETRESVYNRIDIFGNRI